MPTRDEILTLMKGDEFPRLQQLVQMGQSAVPVLLDLLNQPSTPAYLRHRAIAALGEMGSSSAIPDLKAALGHGDPVHRLMAARALAKISPPEAASHLLPLLDDADTSVSLTAVQLLGDVGDRESLTRLASVRDSHDEPSIREGAAAAIREIQSRLA